MSLEVAHPIWLSAKGNPHEVSKAVQQARMLSGQYRTNVLMSKWNTGVVRQCQRCQSQSDESLEHILLDCTAYTEQRWKMISLWLKSKEPVVRNLVLEAFSSNRQYLLQFILDCSVLPTVIRARQLYGDSIIQELFYITRTWCFVIHQKRMKNVWSSVFVFKYCNPHLSNIMLLVARCWNIDKIDKTQ